MEGIGVLDDGDGFVTASEDSGPRGGGLGEESAGGRKNGEGEWTDLGDFMLEEVGRRKRVVASDCGRIGIWDRRVPAKKLLPLQSSVSSLLPTFLFSM